jgi:hypothetical protein
MFDYLNIFSSELGAAGLLTIIFASVVYVLVLIGVYVYFALALMTIANKTKTKNAWLAWIPIANIYLMTQIAKLKGWWTLAILLSVIPIVGGLAFLGISIWWWWLIAERRKKPGWWGILMAIPIVNLIIIGILAWKK